MKNSIVFKMIMHLWNISISLYFLFFILILYLFIYLFICYLFLFLEKGSSSWEGLAYLVHEALEGHFSYTYDLLVITYNLLVIIYFYYL